LALLLRREEIEPLLDLQQAIKVLERTYLQQAEGKLDESPPLRLMGRQVRMVVGGLPAHDKVGVRLSVGSGGAEALALLFAGSGQPVAIMGYPFSELRVAATMALAIDRLAPRGVHQVGLIGSGRLAPHALRGALAVRPVESVRVYSPTAAKRTAFAERESRKLCIRIQPVTSGEEAVADGDIVVVSTNSAVPTLRGTWLESRQAVFGCGRPNEFDDEVYLQAGTIVVSSKVHELGYYDTKLDKPLIRLAANGSLDWDSVLELGQAVSSGVDVHNPVVFRESQGGYSDVALAAYAFEQALTHGLGSEFDFG
jgi:ornithine cyclodeaminase/alanine dehydrogenase-like protein (mu-crystallin family)